jgi:hypothetical protein
MPGMFSIPVFPGVGEVAGVGDCAGMGMPFMSMPCMSVLFGAGRELLFFRAVALTFDLIFRFDFDFAFGFDIFMPGMFCIL